MIAVPSACDAMTAIIWDLIDQSPDQIVLDRCTVQFACADQDIGDRFALCPVHSKSVMSPPISSQTKSLTEGIDADILH